MPDPILSQQNRVNTSIENLKIFTYIVYTYINYAYEKHFYKQANQNSLNDDVFHVFERKDACSVCSPLPAQNAAQVSILWNSTQASHMDSQDTRTQTTVSFFLPYVLCEVEKLECACLKQQQLNVLYFDGLHAIIHDFKYCIYLCKII